MNANLRKTLSFLFLVAPCPGSFAQTQSGGSGTQSAYDQLSPSDKAMVDAYVAAQMEAQRCKIGMFERYYQECILDRMPSAKNLPAIGAVLESCQRDSPCSDVRSKKTGLITNTTAAECFKKYGYDVALPAAAGNIRNACYDLYVDN